MKYLLLLIMINSIAYAGDDYGFEDYQQQQEDRQDQSKFQQELIKSINKLSPEYQANHYLSPEQYQNYHQQYNPQYAPEYLRQYDYKYR